MGQLTFIGTIKRWSKDLDYLHPTIPNQNRTKLNDRFLVI
jgi:hypothetical protein